MRLTIFLTAAALACNGVAWAAPAEDTVTTTQPTPAAAQGAVVTSTADVGGEGGQSHSGADGTVLTTASLSAGQAESITHNFEARFPGLKVDLVRITPVPGLYEIQVGPDLLYADAEVDYVLQGSLIDARARRDLTAERLEALQKVSFDTLPLDRAIKQVKGDGSRKVAVFEDPNCGYCKQLQHTLQDVDNITVYTFLFPILTPDSTTKSRDIWCSADPAKAWHDWMLRGKAAPEAECDTPLEANLALGRKLNVQGTPALFFADGSRVNGALPLDALKKKLDSVKG